MLFFNAPAVFLTEDEVVAATPVRDYATNDRIEKESAEQLVQIIGDDKENIRMRNVAVKELIQKRKSSGDLNELIRGLDEAAMVYTYRDTVEELAKVGRNAVPGTLEMLNNPASSFSDKKCAIWALVQIGVADTDVMQSLQAIAEGPNYAGVADYAKQALDYLKHQ